MNDSRGREDTTARDPPSLVGRLLFGGMLGFSAINSFRNLDAQIGYAQSKGLPYADRLVPLSSGVLAFGSAGVALWRMPALASGAVATFLAAVTPAMHDFWEAEGQDRQNELNHFVKNVAMLGAAVAFFQRALGR